MNVKDRIDEIHTLLGQLDYYQWQVKGHSKEQLKNIERNRREYMNELKELELRDEDDYFEQ
ncbi:hypothetical protein [Enterococcus dispar]